MKTNILFSPFLYKSGSDMHRRPGHEYDSSKNNQWRNTQKAKNAEREKIAVFDDPRELISVIPLFYTGSFIPIICGLPGDSTQIYIRGHGKTNYAGIFDLSKEDEDGKEITRFTMGEDFKKHLKPSTMAFNLSAKDVAERLRRSGLPTGFSGRIKCYNCHSGESIYGFGFNFAKCMYDMGYKSCEIFGYRGQLSSEGARVDTPDSLKGGKLSHHKKSFYEGTPDRASNRRVCIMKPGEEPVSPEI